MSRSIDLKITSMSLSKEMLKEYNDPGIFDYIYVSVVSLFASILFHAVLEFIFSNVQFFLNKIIMFIVNTITTFNINDYLEQLFYSSRRIRRRSSIQRTIRNNQ